jgi:hypothetical protein
MTLPPPAKFILSPLHCFFDTTSPLLCIPTVLMGSQRRNLTWSQCNLFRDKDDLVKDTNVDHKLDVSTRQRSTLTRAVIYFGPQWLVERGMSLRARAILRHSALSAQGQSAAVLNRVAMRAGGKVHNPCKRGYHSRGGPDAEEGDLSFVEDNSSDLRNIGPSTHRKVAS